MVKRIDYFYYKSNSGWWRWRVLESSSLPPTDPALCRVLEAMAPVLVQQFNSKVGASERVTIIEVLVAMLETDGAYIAADDNEEETESELV